MCGINGILSRSILPEFSERISRMNSSINHRGPDNSNIYSNNNIHLGHVRLSIIDLNERSSQPMTDFNFGITLVFNGEIYNFEELKKKLDYKFKTKSDTELVLAFIAIKGITSFLEEANGMFAIAVFFHNENKLIIARDRFGIKPLYYYHDDNNFLFSSEIKGLLNSGLIRAEIDMDALDDYFAYRYVREPNSLLKGICSLSSGQYLLINSDLNINISTYWSLPETINYETDYDEKTILDGLDERINNAINIRLVSDVPLGSYLSGGLDSTLISAILSKKASNYETFTIGEKNYNEFYYSDLASTELNVPNNKIIFDNKMFLDEIDRLVELKALPLSVPNEVYIANMSKELKKKITVVLSGEGADELFAGYGRIFRKPNDYQKSNESNFYDYFIKNYEYVDRDIRDKYLMTGKKYRFQFDLKLSETFSNNENYYNVFNFFHNYHIKSLLGRLDFSTMIYSVEARVPFLDHKLVEYVYSEIPLSMKLKWKSDFHELHSKKLNSEEYSEIDDIPKYALKKVSERYLPKSIIYRKKVGFPVGLKSINSKMVNKINSQANSSNLFDDKLIKTLVESNNSTDLLNWMILNILSFERQILNKNWLY